MPLQFNLISEIIHHGTSYNQSETVDPSANKILVEEGVGKVTSYLEQLASINLIKDPVPIFGANGGMWIGYKLTPQARSLASNPDELRRAVAELTGGARSEVSESVNSLLDLCRNAPINENYKVDFIKTLEEIAICFDHECFIATNSLCGKILEICLKEILSINHVEFDGNFTIGLLLKRIREFVPKEYIDPSLNNISNIINVNRITAIHAHERIPIPSRDQAIMVIFAMNDVVRRHLARIEV